MPEVTPRLGLKIPLGNETNNRANYTENLQIMEANAAKKTDFDVHVTEGVQHKIVDTVNSAKYIWGIENGQLYLQEVG